MSASIVENPETSILARVIGQSEGMMPPEVAQEFLRWSFTEQDRQRMAELAALARAGTLSDDEKAEAEGYERVSSFLGIVKSKARRSLLASSGQ